MIVSIGVDSIAIQRIDDLWQRSGARFLARVFTERERNYCLGKHHPAESLAARFCAKEAIMKCLGTGWSEGVGLLLVGPLLGHASWHAYRAAVARAVPVGA